MQFMAALPNERLVSGERTFFINGCDMFGPIFVTDLRKRLKRWCCIFVCFPTRAVHLELCFGMSCDSILNAFFRFFNSTGNATRHIWCDNGSNFKAGSKALSQSFKNVEWKGVIDKWDACGVSW